MKLNIIKLTLNQLLGSGIQLGYIRKFLNRQLKPYLLGFKGPFNIFNLKYVHLQVRLLMHLIISVISIRQKILIVNHYKEIGNLLPFLQVKRSFYLEGPWVGGFLTNYKRIRLYTNYITKKQPQLHALTTFPSIIIFLNSTKDNWGLKESINLNIPAAVVTGSNFDLLNKTYYPIVGNNHTLEALILYSNLISNAVTKGLIKEQLNLFNLKSKLWVNI